MCWVVDRRVLSYEISWLSPCPVLDLPLFLGGGDNRNNIIGYFCVVSEGLS